MMFSRAAPVVLFTVFCLSVAGAYVTEGARPLTRPGSMSDAQLKALDTYYTEMKLALQVGDTARFEELIELQIQDMQNGSTSLVQPDMLPSPYGELRELLFDGSVTSTKALLARHPDLELNSPQGRYGAVPLIWAMGHVEFMPELVKLLLEHGADPNFQTSQGYTLLHAAASPFNYYGREQDMDEVLDMVPPELVSLPNRMGLTPLHLALINSQSAQVDGLLAHGADPNMPPPSHVPLDFLPGQPPLMIAGGNVGMVQALLGAGADPTATDLRGRRILDVVSEGAAASERDLQDRLSTSAAEESDRAYAADYARARDMIRAAVDGRLARGN
ncbi:ankyrin repeat protein [Litoreibacter meonggei]|uniref:Ankyrin repeat protein n=1 Tax=Litoreibacter meonggei TaxID=1049199 RepID=A0A497X5X9_9RHOB|nr:ankyrin repeat domain-containing protein [Litoreibacter meonggei]RLJ60413.1 ankyrin repeat protein [Litoreibacter meonggei]